MNPSDVSTLLRNAMGGRTYTGKSLSPYAATSIECCRSNYPVSNLLAYCNDSGIEMCIVDNTTEETYTVTSVLDVHMTLLKLMTRYNVELSDIYFATRTHYTPPKNRKNGKAPLSIKTLLAVCSVVHCNIELKPLK